MRTDESRQVEALLRDAFDEVDSYRYNSASIHVRVVDPRFQGKSRGKRVDMIEPYLDQLPEEINSEIMMLVLLAPGEIEKSFLAESANREFEDPSLMI